MATPLVTWMQTVSALWESLTPETRPTVTYHHLDVYELTDSWVQSDRGFLWSFPERVEVRGEQADGVTALVEWQVTATLYVTKTGRGFFDLSQAVADESNQLLLATEVRTSWPAGVSEVITERVVIDEEDEDGILVQLPFRVVCEESL